MSTLVTRCLDPATGELVGVSTQNSPDDVRQAVARARYAQPEWAARSVRERARAILQARDYIAAHADELADIISKSSGKTRTDAMITEVVPSALAASYYARHAPELLRDRALRASSPLLTHKRSRVRRVPYGVVGVISPRNYPFAIPFSDVVIGLLCGNAVVLKTASQSQLAGRALERCFRKAGLPDGVFGYVNLPGPAAGSALLQARVDKLFFTGSAQVGKRLLVQAAETLTPVSLRLGGNDAMIVAADADVDRAVAGAVWAGMQNCGQSSGGVERIYVHRDVYQLFTNLLAERVRGLRVGYDECVSEYDVDLGAMLSAEQVETVRAQIRDALDKGAVIYGESTCPQRATGLYLPATVLTEVDHTMRVMREETFGPVVAVMRVASVEEAIRLCNDSEMGLTGSVWSRDTGAAELIARQIRAGVVTINDHLVGHGLAEVPWGGTGASGGGRAHGELGFEEMTQPQCIVHDFLPGLKMDFWWHPHSFDVYEGMHGILDWLYAKQAARRISGLGRLVRLLPRAFEA